MVSYRFSYRDYAIALYEALREDAFYAAMEAAVQGGSDAREAMLRYLDYSMVEAREYGVLHEPAGHRHGVAVWSVPVDDALSREKRRRKTEFIRTRMGTACLEAYDAMCSFMSGQSARLVPADAWYLSILGILPEHQGRGLGGDLVRPGLRQADAAGVPTFLETFTPRNLRFYERLGFRSVGDFEEPLTRARYWIMARDCFSSDS